MHGFSRWLRALALALTLGGSIAACSNHEPARGPKETLDAYARAVSDGQIDAAYALLSDEAKKSIPREAFGRMIRENPDEVREIARALLRPAGPPLVTATVTAPGGQSLLMVYENGSWRVDGSAIDLYSEASPEIAIRSFIRAYDNRRYDVLMRFVPEPKREGLDGKKLKKAWEGEQKAEMDRITQALAAAMPTARFERTGDRATMAYGAGGTVELVREQGHWKIEELK
ncbi:MAG TPA: hypothetical protein PKA88_17085 [Polyangiaceae bacterium]|nr:hypothetical protein [Polyangiaceae bacterium]